MTKEKLIMQIMRQCEKDSEPVTKEEAEEMAEMELRANQNRHYEKSEAPHKPSTKERKVDETKKRILTYCRIPLEGAGAVLVSTKTETEITFTFGEELYTLKLIKHRQPKDS